MMRDLVAGKKWNKVFLNYGIYILFLAICVFMALSTDKFLTISNLTNILLQTSIIATLAIGVTFVIITGGNDLSMGGVMAVSAGVGINMFYNLGYPVWVGIVTIFIVSILFGLINGYVVAYIKVPAFLATLSTKFIAKGLTLVVSQGSSMHGLPKAFTFFASFTIGGIPLIIFLVIILYVLFYIRLKHTIFGRRVYSVGSNRESARVSGINVERTILLAYVQCGLLVGIAAFLQAGRMNSFWPAMGTDLEFQAIAGTIIGGTAMVGGVGTLSGTFIGVLLMGIINNALNLHGVDANWQEAARGMVILLSVIVDAFRNRYNFSE